jgi:energy-converting hydrogenase Eha subunit A
VLKLWEINRFCRHDETGRYRLIGKIRKIAMWSGPIPQLGYFKRLLYGHRLHVPTEWRKQVKELVVALKALDAAQISLMSGEMFELLMPLFPPVVAALLHWPMPMKRARRVSVWRPSLRIPTPILHIRIILRLVATHCCYSTILVKDSFSRLR